MSAGGVNAHVVARRGDFTVDVELSAEPGTVVGLLGPNGAGKSTILRALAGLTPLAGGHIVVGGRTLEDTSSGARSSASARRLGVVFQDTLLFPHLTALDNVAFGLRHRGSSKREARAAAAHWLERTGLSDLAPRRPSALSGGQAQRVAITRALAGDPDLLLLDEPLSALDSSTTMSLRTFLRRHLTDFAGVSILVTHDALDALVLTDHVVVLAHGTVEQEGEPAAVSRRPRSPHVASLMGLNLVRGQAAGGLVRTHDGIEVAVASPDTGPVFASFPPTAVTVAVDRPHASARNVWRGTIDGITPRGDSVRLQIGGALPVLADVTPHSVADLGLELGTPVWAAVKAVEIAVYPA